MYFNQSEQRWVREPESQDPGYTGSSEYNDDDSMEFGDEPGPEEADDSSQTGSNTLEYFLCDLQLSEHVASLSFTAWLNMTLYCYYRSVSWDVNESEADDELFQTDDRFGLSDSTSDQSKCHGPIGWHE